MRGCFIQTCDVKEFDQTTIRTGAHRENNDQVKQLEGQTEILSYECSGKISPLQVVRNAENAMKQAGYQPVFSGKNENEYHTVTGRKGSQWLMLAANVGGDNNSITFYTQTAVAVGAMKQELAASAETMATELEASGRMALYGINFATNSATITPDSEKPLTEIVTLLNNQPEWKITVEGHTDNVGAKAANQVLSQKRAESVVAWLAAHGVDKARLAAAGFGDSKPLEPNTSDEGKAKNRRVELVKR
jgi:OOP family OmpA-OmpF porin